MISHQFHNLLTYRESIIGDSVTMSFIFLSFHSHVNIVHLHKCVQAVTSTEMCQMLQTIPGKCFQVTAQQY